MTNIKNKLSLATLGRDGTAWFLGIGGSSMSSLAEILLTNGFSVAGSDMQESDATRRLSERGAKVFIGHSAENLDGIKVSFCVMTDAVFSDNPELLRLSAEGVPVYRRAELLGAILSDFSCPVGVAGTNGKTTASSMLASVFTEADASPSFIIGGTVKQFSESWRYSEEKNFCIFESCEFKSSFLNFFPRISVILNISEDHMEYFKTRENLIGEFKKYILNTAPDGTLVYNCECEATRDAVSVFSGRKISFGEKNGDFTFSNVSHESGFYSADIFHGGEFFCRASLSVPGRHNLFNAVAAAAAAYAAGLSPSAIEKGLSAYRGALRRFEYHCKINGAVVADDYGHHPDAYAVTFSAARDMGFKRIIAVHQPHTYSRTRMLMKEFAEVLSTVDRVLVTPIYAARETNDAYNVSSEELVALLPNAELLPDFDAVADRIKALAEPGDLFITLGCGDIYKAARLTARKYGETLF